MFEGFSPSFCRSSKQRGKAGNPLVPQAIADKELGAFFCLLFCGMTKEYGAVRGRHPATLVVSPEVRLS